MLQGKLYTRHENSASAICSTTVCYIPLLSFPLDPLLQQCWSAACSSSPLSAASADVVAGAWSPAFTHSAAAGGWGGWKSRDERGRQETQQSVEFIHCDVCITVPPSDFALFIHVWQSAGSGLESLKGMQLRQELVSRSVVVACPDYRPERILVSPAWKSNKTPHMHNKW